MKNLFVLILILTSSLVYGQSPQYPEVEKHYGIELNKGRKWKVPEAMMQIIQAMQTDLKGPVPQSGSEYRALANQLNGRLNQLTAGCTMKGKGHDELHKWLIPFLERARAFQEETVLDRQKAHYDYLRESISVVDSYFE